MARTLQIVHLIALAFWLACISTSAMAAAVIFPAVRTLDPRIPSYADYSGEHWRIVGGVPANRMFVLTDIAQGAVAVIAIASAWGFRRVAPGRARTIWAAALVAALLALGFRQIALTPRMQREAHAYWDDAAAGRNESALQHQKAFQDLHPPASRIITFTGIAVIVAIGAAAATRPEPAR